MDQSESGQSMTPSATNQEAQNSGPMNDKPVPGPSGKGGGKRLWLIIIAVLVLAGLGGGGYAYAKYRTEQNKPIKVGVALPFSGPVAAAGLGEIKGLQLAQKQLGATKIQLIQEDTKCDADTAKAAVKKLIAQGVVAIVGDACSGSSLAALDEANSAKVVMISASATSPTLSKPNDYFFRVIPNDNFQGKFAATTMYNKGLHRVSVIYDDEPYGQGLSTAFIEAFEALGGTIVSQGKYQNTDTEYGSQVAAIAAAKPDGIYLLSLSTSTAVGIMKGIQAAGVSVPTYSGDSLNDEQIISSGGTAVEGMYITIFTTGTQAFQQALKNAYTDTQTYAAAQAYDAFNAIYLAYKGGARTGETIKMALPGISFTGVSGAISFDKNGEISNPQYKYALQQVHDGKFVTAN